MRKTIDRIKQCRGGFTLLECLVAIVLLSVGVLALSAIQTTYLKTTLQSQITFEANSLADQVFEVILKDPDKVRSFSSSGGCSSPSDEFVGEVCRAIQAMQGKFMSQAEVVLSNTAEDIWSVKVTWESFGSPHTVTKTIGLSS